MDRKIITWKCPICGDKVISNSDKTHQMDTCECGKTGIDLEEFYYRTMGDPEIIATIGYGKD